jgi:hypothetical protein
MAHQGGERKEGWDEIRMVEEVDSGRKEGRE